MDELRESGSARTKNLRAILRSSPDFARLYARRGDAESVNRALEDTLCWNRAYSEGHLLQTADLLGFTLMVNSLTLARHRARPAVRTAA
jgi:PAS domain-containing protein